jgi:hypothetical protein
MSRRVAVAVLAFAVRAAAAEPRATSCVQCHANAEIAGEASPAIVEHERTGAHAAAGLSCHDCHGGNPDPELGEDIAAMDEHFTAAPFVGTPTRAAVPGFCGRCHSDPATMKRFKPDARVDQEREYWTSRHGEGLRAGDTKVATCVDCHGTHGILPPGDTQSPVHPQRVADTCARCHADAARMAGYRLPDGRPLPVDQYAQWRRSVHAEFLLERGDASAPTCNDCHGNHGATPPGVDSVAFVCGQCHGRESELFRASPKAAGFEAHTEYVKQAGAEGCVGCHPAPSPAAELGAVAFTQCSTCHGNHGILRATVALLEPLPPKPCDFCHEAVDAGEEPLEASAAVQERYQATAAALLEEAHAKGLDGAARFDWLVDRARELPAHTTRESDASGSPRLGIEFSRLFDKFRIGRTHYTYPAGGGEPLRVDVVRCGRCHAETDAAETAATFVDHMRRLTTATARAERMLLAAQRGGVRVREVTPHVDAAVTAQIELEVLVHGFSAAPDGKFMVRHREGMQHAERALADARRALDELGTRRRGLIAFLGFLALVLIAMALKIRQISREE